MENSSGHIYLTRTFENKFFSESIYNVTFSLSIRLLDILTLGPFRSLGLKTRNLSLSYRLKWKKKFGQSYKHNLSICKHNLTLWLYVKLFDINIWRYLQVSGLKYYFFIKRKRKKKMENLFRYYIDERWRWRTMIYFITSIRNTKSKFGKTRTRSGIRNKLEGDNPWYFQSIIG